MTFFSNALNNLPQAATSPLAFAAYLVTIIAAFILSWRVQRNKTLLNHIKSLPVKDRLEAFQAEIGQIPLPPNFGPEHYLQARLQSSYLIALSIICLTILCVFGISTFHQDLKPLNANLRTQILGPDHVDVSAIGAAKIVSQDDGSRPAQIDFVNKTNDILRIYWFDEAGVPVFYSQISPGEEYRVNTYFGSQWVVTNGERKAIDRVTPTAENMVASIELPQ